MAAEDLEQWLAQLAAVVRAFPLQAFARLAYPVLGALLGGAFLYCALPRRENQPVRYAVPPPKLPDTETYLENPTVRPAGTTAIQCYAPATGRFLGFVNPATPAGVDRAVAHAQAAQSKWRDTSFAERRAVLRSLLQHVLDHQEEICRVSGLDSGKTMLDAQLGEIMVTCEKLAWTIKHGEAALRPSRRPTNLLMAYKRNEVRYEPLGVVAALVSWNYPFHNLLGPIISAVFAGNGVVVKVSEQTCWSAAYYTSIARGALAAHGHDPALVQSLACWPQTAAHLTSHPDIAHLTFIGSRPVCQQVAASAAKPLTPVVAELGGKDAAVVLDSARGDLARIVEILLRGTFQASGQNCIGIERVIAAPAVYDALVAALAPRVRALRLGPDADVGAMVSDASFARLEALVADAVAAGARLLAGGARHAHPDHPHGFYFAPTLLVDVTPAMRIANEECFGPILTLLRAPTSAGADAVRLANAAPFGLGASVFGRDRDPHLRHVVDRVRAGGVAVNDFAVFYAVQLPFGGAGGSGYGRFAGAEGLRGLCHLKSVCADRRAARWLGVRTAIPPPARYPVRGQARAAAFVGGVVGVGYALTLWEKARAVAQVLRNL
ncbi:ALDH-like protein [Xylariomycetidae sp. FL0641]|nr:ALDH-like protein [Xylariomycetidae sp. FL0641]